MADKKTKDTEPMPLAFRTPGVARVMDMSNRQVQRLIESGALKSLRIGKMRLVRKKTIEEFLAAREEVS